jgi:hypothetical protein
MPYAHAECPFVDLQPAAESGVHAIQLYGDDAEMLDGVARFVGAGLAGGDAVVVVVTPAHGVALRGLLEARGIDCAGAERAGRFVEADSERLLAQLVVDGRPDRDRFFGVVSPMLRRLRETVVARDPNARLRVFGEMAGTLYAAGNHAGALALERHWGELAATMPFTLLCGYPAAGFAENPEDEPFHAVCDHHGTLVPTWTADGVMAAPELLAAAEASSVAAADWRQLSAGLSPDQRDRLLQAARVVVKALRMPPSGPG